MQQEKIKSDFSGVNGCKPVITKIDDRFQICFDVFDSDRFDKALKLYEEMLSETFSPLEDMTQYRPKQEEFSRCVTIDIDFKTLDYLSQRTNFLKTKHFFELSDNKYINKP